MKKLVVVLVLLLVVVSAANAGGESSSILVWEVSTIDGVEITVGDFFEVDSGYLVLYIAIDDSAIAIAVYAPDYWLSIRPHVVKIEQEHADGWIPRDWHRG